MKIAGFELSKQTILIIVVLILIGAALAVSSSMRANKEKQERLDAQQSRMDEAKEKAAAAQNYDYESELQKTLVEKYGQPPEGFKWSVIGDLVAIGTDTMTAEDIVYTFVRSLSILDFSTAQKYSTDSSVVKAYNDYYGIVSQDLTDYKDNFLRKQYKTALTAVEIKEVKDVAVFADGKETVTLNLNVLDLTDKDFWLKDKKEIFETLRVYDETEDDSTKKDQYIYDYIIKAYESGKIGKRNVDIEIVLSKDNAGGWLVTNDNELNATLSYEWGVDTAQYINTQYQDWVLNKHIEEIGK